tara:strand:- start:643 stop:1260 length:618 start_codon:yes stop_codon:yes gene_type:complete
MADTYPYMIANGKISQILDKIKKAAEPSKFTHAFLKQLGFASTNDRAIIPLLKKLEFLDDDSTPTEKYKDLRDTTRFRYALGEQIKVLYADLYAINTKIHEANEDEIKGAISRVTGKDETSVGRYYATYKTLTDIAEFNEPIADETEQKPQVEEKQPEQPTPKIQIPQIKSGSPDFHYNIQIHLPATTDIAVYNAIFKSIKENLM